MGWWEGTWVLHEAAPIQMRMGSWGGVILSFSCGWVCLSWIDYQFLGVVGGWVF